jgi:hypothetical protein
VSSYYERYTTRDSSYYERYTLVAVCVCVSSYYERYAVGRAMSLCSIN